MLHTILAIVGLSVGYCIAFTVLWTGKQSSVKWWHFWNPYSGTPGGLIACGLIATAMIIVSVL